MKHLLTKINNAFKILLIAFLKIINGLFKKDDKKNEIKKNEIKETKETTKVDNQNKFITSNETSTLPDTSSTLINPEIDIKKRLFTDEQIQEVIDKYLEKEYEVKINKIEDKELLEELNKFNKKIHEKINDEIDTGWEIVNEDDLKKKVTYHVEEYFDEKKRLFQKKEVLEKEQQIKKEETKEEIKKENKTTNYTLVTPIKKRLRTNKPQEIKKETILSVNENIKEDIKENVHKEEETTKMMPLDEEKPILNIKEEVANIVASSAIVLSSIAKEIIETPKKEKQEIVKETIKEIKEETIEDKKEEILKEIESIEQELNKEIVEEKKEILKENLDKLKEKKEVIKKTEEVQKEMNNISIDIRPLEIETYNVVKDTKEETNKEEFEDKNYDALEIEINQALDKIDNFIVKNEKYLSEDQKFQLEKEKNKLYSIKNNIALQKENDIRLEEQKLEQPILNSEIEGLKASLKDMDIEHKLELQEEGLKKYEDLENLTISESKKIEKRLLKKKLRKVSRITAISSLATLPFIRNPYFFMFTTGMFIKSSLFSMHSTLAHKKIENDKELEGIQNGRDALERSLDQTIDNINHLDYITNQSILKHPELKEDKEFNNYVKNIRNKMTKNYDKMIKKQYTIDRYLFKTKKNVKVLKKDYKKKPNQY